MVRSGLVFLGALVLTATSALAQQVEWRHPQSLYALQLSEAGWRDVPPSRNRLLAEFRQTNESGRAICVITEHRLPTWSTLSQEQLNQRISAFQPDSNARSISELATAEVEGVAVTGFRFQDAISVGFLRLFTLADDAGAVATEINCRMPAPASTEQEAAVRLFLNSLDFLQTDQTP